jgi:hypothetical protein
MEQGKIGKIFTGVGLALGIAGSAMAIHHRVSYRKWADGEDPCHGRAGLTLTGMVIPLLIAAHGLNKREKH